MKKIELDGYKEYLATEDGKIYATHLNRFVSQYDNGLGYMAVKLKKCNGDRKQMYVHRLIAMCFIPNPFGYTDVNHKDGDKTNNSVYNLEWVSRSENLKHAFDNRLLKGFVEVRYKN